MMNGECEKPFQCTVCDLRFTTNAAQKIHMAKHGKKKTLKCPLCGDPFKDPLKLRKHRLDLCSLRNPKTSIKTFNTCAVCDMKFHRPIAREKHMQEAHGVSDPRCFQCEYKPADLEDLEEHVKIHYKKPKTVVCTECGNSCNSVGMLLHHMKTHKEEEVACKECDFVGKNPRGLRTHLSSGAHNPKKQKTVTECTEGTKMFPEQKVYKTLPNSGTKDTIYLGSKSGLTILKKVSEGGLTILKLESASEVTSPMINTDGNKEADVKTEPIRCMECSYIAANDKDLTRHIENHITNAMFKINYQDIK
ncbi:unnamed protein product [Meganyctiphanes norvegica]|uniref:C2H2-type domain-containing protein n=2 Tax=Meganyctiphanes norvegica TaxID=48144 RepID=A0AAV2RRJ5_MEGNR